MGNVTLPKPGYDLAAKILESHPNDAIETMLKISGNGAECDWLEFKASMTLLQKDKDRGETEELLHWKYVKSLAAIANTRGGAFVIGVDDTTHEAVPLSSAEGLEEYYRMMILGKLEKAEKKYSKNNRKYSLKKSITKDLDPRYVPYNGTTVLVFLVKPSRLDDELYYIKEESDNRSFTILPYRVKGCGEVKELTDYHDIQRYVKEREEYLASTDLSSAWAELDAEQQASKADEILDNAIRTYHAKLEEETRKKLRAFIPLDVEGDEPDEDDEEFENPQAISVFDEDDDAWLNSNNKDGGTSDKGSKGLEVEDDSVESEDDDESDDDEEEPSKRIIKIGLYELLEQQNRVVLVGEPGAGKTTCLAHFAVQQGKMERPRPHLFAFVALGRWVDGGSVRGLVEKTCGVSQAQIDTLLAEKRLHLILDALNECPDRLRPGAMENIRILLQDHPDLPVVLSSRKAEGIKLQNVPVFEVQSMDADRQRLFLERYLHDAEAAIKILDSLLKQPGGASIAQNPMLLRMVVDVVRANGNLPTGRATLYRRWLENWYVREEKKAKKAKEVLPWSKEESIRLLSQMAFAGRAEGYRDIPIDMACRSLGDNAGTFLDRLCQGPLLEIDEGFVHFRHETIQEYLCAEWLLTEPTALNALPEKDYDTWGMPIAYAAELRLPNKLPDEMSEAVWEMNPWLAALITESRCIPSFAFESTASRYKLAVAIANQNNLLDKSLDTSFSDEILHGQLFLQMDAPLTYIIRAVDDISSVWTVFECSYVLRFPEKLSCGSKVFRALNKLSRPLKIVRKGIGSKKSRFIILDRDNLFQLISTCLPSIPQGVILTLLADYFVNFSSPYKIRDLFYGASSGSLLPIDVFFRCIGKYTTYSQLSHLFGGDFVSRALHYLANNPNEATLTKAIVFLDQFGMFSPALVQTACVSVLKSEFHKLDILFSVYPCMPIGQKEKFVYCRGLNQLIAHLPEETSASVLIGTVSLRVRQFLATEEFQRLSAFVILQNGTTAESETEDSRTLKMQMRMPRPIIYKVREQEGLSRNASEISSRREIDGTIATIEGCRIFRKQDLMDASSRLQIVRELEKTCWEMTVRFLSLDRRFLFFFHPCFSDNVYCSTRSTNYQDVFEVGQKWKVKVYIRKNKKDGSFGFVAWDVVPTEINSIQGRGGEKPVCSPKCDVDENGSVTSIPVPVAEEYEAEDPRLVPAAVDEKNIAEAPLSAPYSESDLADSVMRQRIDVELRNARWDMTIARMSEHGGRLFFSHPLFSDEISCGTFSTKYADVFEVGQKWSVVVGVKKKKGQFLFVPVSVEPAKVNPACPYREGKPENKSTTQISEPTDNQDDNSSPPVPLGRMYRRSDLSDAEERKRIKSELKAERWEMTVDFISEDRGYLFFRHPSFLDGVYCPARSTQYKDVFKIGQVWNVKVCVNQNKKDGSWGFCARSVKPFKGIPVALPQGNTGIGMVGETSQSRTTSETGSHISIYIDETWPGTQDHAYENIGVIGGVVVPWEGVDEKRLPVIKTHLDNGSVARNAIQTMLGRSDVFPFVFPIKWDHAVGAGGRQYFELVQHALMLLLGWMLPQRNQPTTVDIFLEHISGYMDGHDETDFISSLTQAMRLLSGGRRFANWQIRRVEWVDKEFGYVPYGDLVCKTCVPREEQQLLAREVKVREWEGFLPFSKDVFSLLRDMDTASPSGLADLLISFAKVADDTPFFRRVRKLAIDRAKADEAVCTALISRFEECYARPDRDMALLNRVVPHFLNEFPPDLFKERPRMQLLRILIGFQHANHNGDPDLATALVDQYHSLRPRILELDRDLCAYADLNLAVHHHDSFEFDKALSLVDGWINDPLFPALSVMNRGRMYSSRGQSLALLGRNQEADEAFARALSIFSAEPALLASDIAQTKTYQAMNALDHDAPSAVPLVEGLLGKSLIATALNTGALLEKPFAAHLFLKTLWRMREGRSVVQDALIKNLPADIAFRKQHPYELILFYLALLTKEANPSYAKACVREMEQFFEEIEFGGTLGLIHAYMRVMLKRHGLNAATEKDFFEELDIVEQYLTKAGTIINEFRMRWGNPSMSIDGILPFNYC